MISDWFLLLLALTISLRGLGAGIILGLALMNLPVRKRIPLIPYAQFTRAQYRGNGVKAYAGMTILGALLTLILTFEAFILEKPVFVSWALAISLIATILGFVGTSQALPAMKDLWSATDEDEALLNKTLDRFARWHIFGAVWHIVAFFALIVALAN